jgi:hypothetical protein
LIEEEILSDLYTWLRHKYEKMRIIRLYIGKKDMRLYGSTTEVIVLVIDGINAIKEITYIHERGTFPIICKLWQYLPVEDKHNSPEPGLSCDKMFPATVESCIQSISQNLFKQHSNLEYISASFYRLKDVGEERRRLPELCIVLYCSCKGIIPLHETEFPKHIEGFKTDVREGFFYLYGNDHFFKRSTDVLDPLMIGASIGKKGKQNHRAPYIFSLSIIVQLKKNINCLEYSSACTNFAR